MGQQARDCFDYLIGHLGADPAGPHAAARRFLAWLEPKAGSNPCRWLVVLDDVADPADLAGWWPPASPHGRTLVTTRRRDAALTGDSRRLVEVGLFSRAEAVACLTDVLTSHGRIEPAEQLAGLADDPGVSPAGPVPGRRLPHRRPPDLRRLPGPARRPGHLPD